MTEAGFHLETWSIIHVRWKKPRGYVDWNTKGVTQLLLKTEHCSLLLFPKHNLKFFCSYSIFDGFPWARRSTRTSKTIKTAFCGAPSRSASSAACNYRCLSEATVVVNKSASRVCWTRGRVYQQRSQPNLGGAARRRLDLHWHIEESEWRMFIDNLIYDAFGLGTRLDSHGYRKGMKYA